MKDYFSIGEAAKTAGMTSETLRHYDRIGLVKPSRKDEWTGYRYYTKQDIVLLNTVRALQQMDLPLQKIKEVLEVDDLQKIIAFLTAAEKRADEKMASLRYSKSKIQSARLSYEEKLRGQKEMERICIKHFPERVIMLSDTMEAPTLDNLWNYLGHFYDRIEPLYRDLFQFEDLAGIYTENGIARMFAMCIRYKDMERLRILPAGAYLYVDCTEKNREHKLEEILQTAKESYRADPKFTIQQIVVSGILRWNYQIQVFLGDQCSDLTV